MTTEVVLTRACSGTEVIERLVQATTNSLDAALYRFNNPRLAQALADAARRGVQIRLVLDRTKYKETQVTRDILSGGQFPFRLLHGRRGAGTKMHHKFAILDNRAVVTGSYNWTLESEEQNYENLLVLRDSPQVEIYRREFESLWAEGAEIRKP